VPVVKEGEKVRDPRTVRRMIDYIACIPIVILIFILYVLLRLLIFSAVFSKACTVFVSL
jgi:hypothetical protein